MNGGYKEIADRARRDRFEIGQRPHAALSRKMRARRLIDIGDGVACLEFHSKMNSIGGDTVQMMNFAIDEVEKNHVGLVVGNQGGNFSAGANIMLLLLAAQEEEWDDINLMIHTFQHAMMRLRYSAKPVVTAPLRLDFGRRLRDCAARRQSSRGGRNLYGFGRSRRRLDSGGRRHERIDDAGDGRGEKNAGRRPARVFRKRLLKLLGWAKSRLRRRKRSAWGFLRNRTIRFR